MLIISLCICSFALIGYLIGSIMFGFLYTNLFLKKDIRTLGSLNPGATNVGRVNKTIGRLTYVSDMLKGYISVVICSLIFNLCIKHHINHITYSHYYWISMFGGLFSVIGHCFPIQYLYFLIKWDKTGQIKHNGGKGASTFSGCILGYNFYLFIICFVLFTIIKKTFKYVSLASILTSFIVPYLILIPYINGNAYIVYFDFFHEISYDINTYAILIIFIVTGLVVIYKHKSNIVRLLNKTETKITNKK